MTDYPVFRTAGEQGLVVEWPEAIDPSVNEQVIGLYRRLMQRSPDGYIEAIPSYRSLLVLFDPARMRREALLDIIRKALAAPPTETTGTGQEVVLPTVYGGEHGPDLDTVARHAGLSHEEVIRRHSTGEYRVYMLGFTPGFPYLGGLDPRLATPRLANPRTRIPAGSVGIAGPQTGVYPIASPGGWQLIGRTPRVLFDPLRDPPARIQPGDRVRFQAVDEKEYRILAEKEKGEALPALGRDEKFCCRVIQPGLLTTVQDLGRWGYQHLGVPTAGAMDTWALRIANLLLGNPEDAPALEMTWNGPELEFQQDSFVAVTGGDLGPRVDGRPLPMWTVVPVRAGNRLGFSGRINGCRAYLAIAGGFSAPRVMNSASTYVPARLGGLDGRALKTGDRLAADLSATAVPGKTVPEDMRGAIQNQAPLPVVMGPQEDRFTPAALDAFLASEYTLTSQTDRMGSRLEGPTLTHRDSPDIISDGIPPGAVQVPGHGMPIVMTADRQTTGGYPKIAVVTRKGLDRLAQKVPGDPVRFAPLSLEDAEKEYRKQEERLVRWIKEIDSGWHWWLTVAQRTYHVIVQKKE